MVEYTAQLVGKSPSIIDLGSGGWAYLQAGLMWLLPNPPLSPDNLRSMEVDSVTDGSHDYPGWQPDATRSRGARLSLAGRDESSFASTAFAIVPVAERMDSRTARKSRRACRSSPLAVRFATNCWACRSRIATTWSSGRHPEEMLARGFRPVGKDFPVFLHPHSHEEYALARTERKTGPGYRGFAFHAAPEVTLARIWRAAT
jgi:hypothetical protein